MDAAERKGRVLPQWFLDEPPLTPSDEFYMSSFWRLSTERQVGMGLGPIPHSACEEYARRRGVCSELVDHFCAVMQAMDGAYLGWVEGQRSKGSAQTPQPGQTVVRERDGGKPRG